MRKFIVITAVLLTLSLLMACNSAAEDVTINEEYIQEQTVIAVSGVVESTTSRNIYTTLGLIVESVYVQVGDFVYEGQVLATLDTSNLELSIVQQRALIEQARRSSQLAVSDTRRMFNEATSNLQNNTNVNILNAEASLNSAEIDLNEAMRNYDIFRMLYNEGAVSQSELRQRENALELASVSHRQAQNILNSSRSAAAQDVEMLRSQVSSAEISADLIHMEAVLLQMENNLNDAKVTSPISGTVTAVIAKEGSLGAGLMFIVEDTDNLRIMTSFREYDLAKISTGMEVYIASSSGNGETYIGQINRINPAASLGSPVVEFEAEVTVISPQTGLRIGMNTRINIVIDY